MSEVIEACQRINKSGSKPSIALIKTRLSTFVPLPIIIKGLTHWQANPSESDELITNKATKHVQEGSPSALSKADLNALYERVSSLENAVTNLQTEVQALKQQQNR